MDKWAFQPSFLALALALSRLAAVNRLVSCAKMMSALERASAAAAKLSKELPLAVSMAQRPLVAHHLSAIEHVALQHSSGVAENAK